MVNGYSVRLDRHVRSIRLAIDDRELNESILHPWLALALAVALDWEGGFSLHGATIGVGGVAWGLLGAKGAGKSTTVAALAARGVDVLSDDSIALRDGVALAGPRHLDLRRAAAVAFPDARPIGRVALRHRWRLPLAPVPPELPFAGFVVLEWGPRFSVAPVPVPERLSHIGNARLVDLPATDGPNLLNAMSLPMLRVCRPRVMSQLDASTTALVDALQSHHPTA
jgi:hypothetical protein